MKYLELENKSDKELLENLKDLQGRLSQFNFQLSSHTLKNSSQIKKTKKDIARVRTALNKKNR